MVNLNCSPFPLITTERLVLRQLTSTDAIDIAALRSDEKVNKYLDRQAPTSIDEANRFIDKINTNINNNECFYWAIALKNNNSLIGTICYWNIVPEDDTAEIGYELLPGFQGKGIMQEALPAIIEFGFNGIKLQTILALLTADNEKSIKILEKNNFKRDTVSKYKIAESESFVNMAVYFLQKKS